MKVLGSAPLVRFRKKLEFTYITASILKLRYRLNHMAVIRASLSLGEFPRRSVSGSTPRKSTISFGCEFRISKLTNGRWQKNQGLPGSISKKLAKRHRLISLFLSNSCRTIKLRVGQGRSRRILF